MLDILGHNGNLKMVTLASRINELRPRADALNTRACRQMRPPAPRRIGLFVMLLSSLALSGCGGSIALKSTASDPATGTLTASSGTVNFGAVAVGQTASTSVTLVNQGSAAVEISQLNMTGQSFSLGGSSSLPVTVAANGSLALTLHFNPAATGAATGQLTITSNSSAGNSLAVGLNGTGVPVLSGLTCANGSITGAGTDICSVTLNAAADSGGLGVNLTSSNSAVAVPASVTIAAGATGTEFTASVSPVTSVQAATLSATVGGVAETFALQLGASIPTLGISASSLAFGSVAVNSAVTQPLTLSSTGTVPVTVSAAALSGNSFSLSGEGLPVTLAPGQTATMNVQFNPTAAGAAAGQLTLTSNSLTGSTTAISVSGTGVPVLNGLSCSSGSIAGSGPDNCTVTLNTAAAGGGFTVSLASDNPLVVVPATVTVAAGAISASFTATVSPVSSTESATLTANAGGVSENFALQLTVGPTLSLSTTSVDFGDVGVNAPATQTVTLASTGGAAVTIDASSLSGSGFAASGPTFPLTLPPNQTATLSVQFDPTTAGTTTGQLTLSSNSVDGASKRIRLRAKGVPVLNGLSCTSGSMTGAGTDNCTMTLNAAADSGGFTVSLATNNTAVTVPPSLTVAAGTTSASFDATVSAVNVAQAVTLTASAGSVTRTFGMQLGASQITLSLSTTNVAFGNVNVNTAATQPLTLTSTGTAALTVSAVTVTGSGFTVSGASFPLTLNPNQTATLTVQFDPTAAGAATGSAHADQQLLERIFHRVSLSGTGVPVLNASDLHERIDDRGGDRQLHGDTERGGSQRRIYRQPGQQQLGRHRARLGNCGGRSHQRQLYGHRLCSQHRCTPPP